jgi:uncharacterized membrane protein
VAAALTVFGWRQRGQLGEVLLTSFGAAIVFLAAALAQP